MSYLDIIDRVLEEQKKKKSELRVVDLSLLTLSELAKRHIALEIYSEALSCELWLCSNEEMASQVKQDDPEAVCYTVGELRELIRINPTSEDINRVHEAKGMFPKSRVVNSKLKEEF